MSTSTDVGRASYRVVHVKHGGGSAGDRTALAREQHRAVLDASAQRKAAEVNHEIDLSRTHLNIDLVNDGEGNFVPLERVGQVVAYGQSRDGRHHGKIRSNSWSTTAVVFHLPKSMCRREEWVNPLDPVNDDGSEKVRVRWVAKDEQEMLDYFERCREYFAAKVIGGPDAIHGVAINLDETTPHMQLLCDTFVDHPDYPGELKVGYSQIWGTERTPALKEGETRKRKVTGKEKMAGYHTGLRKHLREHGFEEHVALENSDRADEDIPLPSYKRQQQELNDQRRDLSAREQELDERQESLETDEAAVANKLRVAQGEKDKAYADREEAKRALNDAEILLGDVQAAHQALRDRQRDLDDAVRRATDTKLGEWLKGHHPEVLAEYEAAMQPPRRARAYTRKPCGAMQKDEHEGAHELIVRKHPTFTYPDGSVALDVELRATDRLARGQQGLRLSADRHPKTKKLIPYKPYAPEQFEEIKRLAGSNQITDEHGTAYAVRGHLTTDMKGDGYRIGSYASTPMEPSREPLTPDWYERQQKHEDRVSKRMSEHLDDSAKEMNERNAGGTAQDQFRALGD